MKKLIISMAALLVAFSAQAQVDLYVKAGVSVDNMKYSTGSFLIKPKSAVGYDVVFGVQKPIVADLYVGAEAGLGTRGFKISEAGVSEGMLHHALKLVPQVGYKIDIAGILTLDPHVGLALSYDLFGKAGDVKLADYRDEINLFDLAIAPGVAFWYGNFGLDVTYQYGFLNMSKNYEESFVGTSKFSAKNLIVRLAYRF